MMRRFRARGRAQPVLRGALALATLGLFSAALSLGCEGRREVSSAPDAGAAAPAPLECPPRHRPPQLGVQEGGATAVHAQRVLEWRRQVEEDRLLEELRPDVIAAGIRIEQSEMEQGCVDLDDVVDVGRALFLRTFTGADGHGHGGPLVRFHRGSFGGPDAHSCQNCHWKGSAAGAGDRADNAYLFGDGNDVTTSDVRNPPALWGAGWVELVAREMSAELLRSAEDALQEAEQTGRSATRELRAKGVSFGSVHARIGDDGVASLDTSDVEGVDEDLVVKPFGWKRTYATLRDIIGASLQLHLGLQAEEVVHDPAHYGVEVGAGPPNDPDSDGRLREITDGQVTALVLYVATLDVPPLEAPEEGAYRDPVLYSKTLEFIRSPEYTARWLHGYRLFQSVGCATCHVPFLPVEDPRFRTRSPQGDVDIVVDLAAHGAQPGPTTDDTGRHLIPAFSDFRRHDLGPGLSSRHEDRGVPKHLWLTRPLWGIGQTSPYLHTGSAMTFDYAIARHGGEAASSAAAYRELAHGDVESLRFFLGSLARAPTLRVR